MEHWSGGGKRVRPRKNDSRFALALAEPNSDDDERAKSHFITQALQHPSPPTYPPSVSRTPSETRFMLLLVMNYGVEQKSCSGSSPSSPSGSLPFPLKNQVTDMQSHAMHMKNHVTRKKTHAMDRQIMLRVRKIGLQPARISITNRKHHVADRTSHGTNRKHHVTDRGKKCVFAPC